MSQSTSGLTLGAIFYEQFELLDVYGPPGNVWQHYWDPFVKYLNKGDLSQIPPPAASTGR